MGGLSAVVQLVVTLFIMVSYSPIIAAVFLGTMPVYAGLMRYSSRRLRPTFDSLEEAYSRHAAKQLDAIKGIEAAKSAGAEEGMRRGIQREFAPLADRVFQQRLGAHVLRRDRPGGRLPALHPVPLGRRAARRERHPTIGELVAINSLVLLANAPIATLLGLWDSTQQASVLLQRLQDVLEADPEQVQNGTPLRNVHRLSGRIALRQVGLSLPGRSRPPDPPTT